jgi:hypothetical protein
MVFKFVRVCAWHLAWHVRVTLPVVHVHARMDACMRVCACRACALIDVAVTASKCPGENLPLLTRTFCKGMCGYALYFGETR